MQVHTFYNGLSDFTITVINSLVGGSMMKKTIDQAYGIIEDMATNSNQWPRDRLILRKTMGSDHVAQLTKQLQRQQGVVNAIQTNPWEMCESCGGQHNTIECQSG